MKEQDSKICELTAELSPQPDSDVYSCMKEAEKFFAELLAKYLPDYASTQHFVSDNGDSNARTRRTRRN